MIEQILITDDGDLRKYYIQVPNIIDDTEMSVYAFRLYVHLKRVAGDKGTCWQSTKTLARFCKMSNGMVSKAKIELVELDLINIQREKNPKGGRDFHHIRILNKWLENMQMYSTSSHHELASSSGELASSPHELKNNSLKKEPKTPPPPEPKPKSEYVKNMEHLEKVFADTRGTETPDWSRNGAGLNSTWRSPLRRILKKCNGDLNLATHIITKATKDMMEDNLTFDIPTQIEKTANSLIADLKPKSTTKGRDFTAERLAKEKVQ